MSTARFLPVSRVTLLALFVGTAALVFAHAHPLTGWAYADWAAASAEARQSLALAGVWAAGCASWAASLHSTAASATCPVPAVRNGAPLVRSQSVLLIAAAIVGEAAGLAPTYVWCAIHSTYAADLRPLVIVGGVAVLVASVCFGYLCGVLLPRLLAVPAAVVLAFGAVAFTGADGSPLSPVWPFDVAAGLAEPGPVAGLRIAFYITTAILCLLASARWLEERRTTPATVIPTVASMTPILLIVLLSATNSAPLVHRDASAGARCASVGDSRVCVHPARATLLPELAAAVRSMQTVIGPDAPLPARIYDATTWPPESSDGLSLQLQDERPAQWRAYVALDLSSNLLRTAGCGPGADTSGSSPGDVASAAAVWLASQVDPGASAISGSGSASELARDLLRAPPAAVTPLLRHSLADLRACRATVAELLPR